MESRKRVMNRFLNEYGQNKLLMLVFACVGEMINLQTRFYGRFCVCTLEVIGMFIRY